MALAPSRWCIALRAFTEAAGLSWLSLTPASRAQLLEFDYVPPQRGLGYTTGRVPLGSPAFAASDSAWLLERPGARVL